MCSTYRFDLRAAIPLCSLSQIHCSCPGSVGLGHRSTNSLVPSAHQRSTSAMRNHGRSFSRASVDYGSSKQASSSATRAIAKAAKQAAIAAQQEIIDHMELDEEAMRSQLP